MKYTKQDLLVNEFSTDKSTHKALVKLLNDGATFSVLVEKIKRLRPGSKKLKNFLDELVETVETVETVEAVEAVEAVDVVETVDAVWHGNALVNEFSTDKGTHKALVKLLNKGATFDELVEKINRLRPGSKKLKNFLESVEAVEAVEAVESIEAVVTVGAVKSVEAVDYRDALLNEFSTDKGTHKALVKLLNKDATFDELVEKINRLRPGSKKLKTFLDELVEAIETVEDEIPQSSKEIEYIITGMSITIKFPDGVKSVNKNHPRFDEIKQALSDNDLDKVEMLVNLKKAIKHTFMKQGSIEIKNNKIYFNKLEIHGGLVDYIIHLIQEDLNILPFVKLLEKIKLNPSTSSAEDVFAFLQANKISITDDGDILVYKKIKQDFTDCYTGRISNKVGNIVKMKRSEVNDNRHKTCSTGLHVCGYNYLNNFYGDRIVACLLNPIDIVSVPTDYDRTKIRCCKYKVLHDITKEVNRYGDVLSNDKFVKNLNLKIYKATVISN